ncbi:alpha/beta fold hydrolase [Actinoplanes subglobosus]|uniref:Alpha/beta hydrolase n=1 Tax=Actinoplanes subglobosus TaxID=1547892 RepID=A0ABV8IHZ2_9ACTN
MTTHEDPHHAVPSAEPLTDETVRLRVDDVDLALATVRRDGHREPVVFLHGFGSTKEDYADAALHPAFTGRGLLAYDAPGCGQSDCSDTAKVSIPFLVATAEAMLDHAGIDRFHLVGHSMGGLTALLLAARNPDRVLSFVDIEGNVAPEDCFLSRQVVTHPATDDEAFFDDFIDRNRRTPAYSAALYAAGLRHKVRPGVVRPIFTSMVELSDHGDLMTTFLKLPCPLMFMYGEQNAHLSYLPALAAGGVELAPIPRSGHWPMYANPVAMWDRIAAFHTT